MLKKYKDMIDTNTAKGISEWFNFEKYLKTGNRYKLTPKLEDFIKTVLYSVCVTVYPKNTKLHRAMRGCKRDDNNNPYNAWSWKELGIPNLYKIRGGRANPAGVQNFYLSVSSDIAVAETKPMLDEIISIGAYKLKTDIRLVDTRKIDSRTDNYIIGIWKGIHNAFSYPCTSDIEHIEYIPTQYLSEIFRFEKYDGIIYESARYRDGSNIVLFNYKKVARFERDWVKIKKIRYETSPLPKTWTK